ncbi:MAG: hypothetical protein WCT03_15065, partial [Candidatus Obscuribacterales bacterium]
REDKSMKKALLLAFSALMIFANTAQAKEVQVKGYTKKDGTKVEAYTKTVKDKDTVEVKGYTKKDGTVVKSYTRKKSAK